MNEAEKNLHSDKQHNFDHKQSDIDFYEPNIVKFPKEFRKTMSDRIDRRFVAVLTGSIIVHFALMLYFLNHPFPKGNPMLTRIQKQYAKNILEQKAIEDTPIAKFEFKRKEKLEKLEKKKSMKSKLAEKSSSRAKSTKPSKKLAERRSRREGGGRAVRAKSQEQIAATIASKGILALLTSSSSVARGEEVEDVLGKIDETQQDLGKVLSNLSGIKTSRTAADGSGGNGASVKGGRAAKGGGIDDLVSGLGTTKYSSFERSGELVVVNESPLIEGNRAKGIIGRNQDDIQAVVLKHKNAIQYCYERALKRNPNLKGKLVVRFTITPEGTVKNVKIISSTLQSRQVEQCVLNRIRRWSDFGSIKSSYGDTTIRQVFAFGY
jgi:TonB family protein